MVNSTSRPVSLKMRIGVSDSNKLLFKEIAKIAEQEGIKMITLHPRTVSQGYSGHSDWSMIKKLKEIVEIPVVGNGDITTPEIAKSMIEQTGCDYVMIGRGAMGNPFIFEQINDYLKYGVYKNYNFSDRLEIFLDYVSETSKYKIKFVNIKEQAIRFTKGTVGGSILRKRLTATKDIDELKKILVQTVSV